jgi:short-subunit dehydrogenase
MEFRGKTAIVTGASSGIGRATARELARLGATVIAVARREARLQELVSECRGDSPESSYLAGDLSEKAFAREVVTTTASRHGGVDILINNAAIPFRKSIYEVTSEEVEDALEINFLSGVRTTLAAIPHMLNAGGGTIVNVSSFASKVVPSYETVYAATKSALNGFSEGLWNDLAGSNIHVCLVHPGPIDTEIWDKGEQPAGYQGVLYPPEMVARGIIEAIEKRRHEVVLPRGNPQLVTARLLRFVAPSVLRRGVARMHPVDPEELARARERAREIPPRR